MLRKQFCFCKCYYERNIYVKEYDFHFTYINSKQFINDYKEILFLKGVADIKSAEVKVEKEIKRRKDELQRRDERKKLIQDNYVPFHQSLFSFSESFLHHDFKNSYKGPEEVFSTIVKKHHGKLYSFPVFNDKFCDMLLEEINNFENSPLPKKRPNTMNRYGVDVDELGLTSLITELRIKYLKQLCSLFFPDWGGKTLDSHKAFIVTYRKGEDTDLSYHYDNAEVTLNVSLNDKFEGGELYFGAMRQEDSSVRYGYEHSKGWGILHRGQQMHGAMEITEGERYNLIIWMRSSDIRNELCPMCDESPKMVPVEEGTGDGFTVTVHDVCTTT